MEEGGGGWREVVEVGGKWWSERSEESEESGKNAVVRRCGRSFQLDMPPPLSHRN